MVFQHIKASDNMGVLALRFLATAFPWSHVGGNPTPIFLPHRHVDQGSEVPHQSAADAADQGMT